jgi:hypothetical protein
MQYIIYHDGVDSDFEEVCDDDAKSLSTPSWYIIYCIIITSSFTTIQRYRKKAFKKADGVFQGTDRC